MPFDFRMMEGAQVSSGLVMNASETGLLIHALKDMPIGARLTIDVLFAEGSELATFVAIAEIVWKRAPQEEQWKGYRYGLRFVQILGEDCCNLERILKMGAPPPGIPREQEESPSMPLSRIWV